MFELQRNAVMYNSLLEYLKDIILVNENVPIQTKAVVGDNKSKLSDKFRELIFGGLERNTTN